MQEKQWKMLNQARQQKRLPHALLFSGMAGAGKKHFALMLAHALLCTTPKEDGHACGQCRMCHLTQAQTHPDLLLVEPEETGQVIKIDQIRDVVSFVNETAQQGGYRVIIINPANAMNMNAGNALLKSLEEPTPRCLLILISNQSSRLLPTIKSRCQEVRFSNNASLNTLPLLEADALAKRDQLYQGLYALTKSQADPLQFAALWQEFDLRTLSHLMQSWIIDLLKIQLTHGEPEIMNQDFQDKLMQLAQRISLKNTIHYLDCIQEFAARVIESTNLNRLLVLEQIFIQWVKYVSR